MAQFGGFGGGSSSGSGATSSGGISGGSSRGSAGGFGIGTGPAGPSRGLTPSAAPPSTSPSPAAPTAPAPTVTTPTTGDGIDAVQPAAQTRGLVTGNKRPLDTPLQLDPSATPIAPALVGVPNYVTSGSPKWLASSQLWGRLDSIDDLLNFAARTQRVC